MSDDENALLSSQIERLTGGKVVALERQPRWRKAWYATVTRDGADVPIYVRGDKQIDAEPFPGLDREAAILGLFAKGGLPVPHVYGMARDPIGIVMDRVPGTRDVAEAADDAERQRLAEGYIDILARMHRLDTAPFVAAGIEKPEGAEAVALAYVNPHIPLYRRTKRSAQPLVEWALKWVRRNVPRHRDRACVIHGDPGQFLFADGRITCIYDFEATHIGDPLHDLAAMRTRHGTEPLGADPEHLVRYYSQITGEQVDLKALSFHTAAFMLTVALSLAGPLTDPKPADMQLEYLTWDLMCRRALLWAIAEHMGVQITPSPALEMPDGRSARVGHVLDATIARIDSGGSSMANVDRDSARVLALWARGEAMAGAAHEAADMDRAAAILGFRPASWRETDVAMERFVEAAGPEQDAALFDYFARQIEDQVAEALPIQERLALYALTPLRS